MTENNRPPNPEDTTQDPNPNKPTDVERQVQSSFIDLPSRWDRYEPLAEICNQHLGRGSRAYIEGRLQTRAWHDTDGQQHFRMEVVAEEMIMLDQPRLERTAPSAREEDSGDEEDQRHLED